MEALERREIWAPTLTLQLAVYKLCYPLGLSFPINEMGIMLLSPRGPCEDKLHIKSLARGWHTLGTQGNDDCGRT